MAFSSRSYSVLCALSAFAAAIWISGCILQPQNRAATQPATEIDLATTQPSYWLSQPPAAQVQANDFDALWEGCKSVARGYLFTLDREDFRSGLITTEPMVSKQIWEVWRPDTGSFGDVVANSLATIRRTLRFEISRDPQGSSFTITPKVLVERLSVLERRVTSVAQYRSALAGPTAPARFSISGDEEPPLDVPVRYWYPVGRDRKMEEQVAARLRRRLEKAPGGASAHAAGRRLLTFDGSITAPGPTDLVYIDLGAKDGIVPGMTFEVYDARASLPPLEHFAADNPGSKGWIEVERADHASSACRIRQKTETGQPVPGDRIFNFIYRRDAEGRNRFVVAGDFANDRGAVEVLIQRWRGMLEERVSRRTDYVILGQAPADEAARNAYREVKTEADERGIPIIDEARFNLLVRQFAPP